MGRLKSGLAAVMVGQGRASLEPANRCPTSLRSFLSHCVHESQSRAAWRWLCLEPASGAVAWTKTTSTVVKAHVGRIIISAGAQAPLTLRIQENMHTIEGNHRLTDLSIRCWLGWVQACFP